ncbi:MAG TPA: glycosyltransferase family 39 protein, partial [Bacteroidota bacterium]|nr:glycosyltransferase family 39 protein [Bacteroidota bacterium]
MLRRLNIPRLTPEASIIACLAFANILFHLLLPEYGYLRDEMYYVAIADGFSWSNLDMPPGAPLYLKLFLVLFGHSLKTVHLAASVCGSIVIVFGCLIAKEFGGKRYAIGLTGLFLIFSGLSIFGSLYTYDDPSFIIWAAVLYLIVRMLNGADGRLWLLAGVLLGLGVLTKLTILFLGLAIFLSLWLTPERQWYRRPWIWLGAGIALLCAVPYALWQWEHGWYFLNYAATYSQRTTHASPVIDFLWNQVLPNNLFMMPVWLAGLILLLFAKPWSRYRFFGFSYVILCVTLFLLGGQFYFMLPIYVVLVAAGSVAIERRFARRASAEHPMLGWKVAIPVAYFLLSLPALPFAVPLLPVDMLISYLRPVGVNAGVKTEDRNITNLPQHVADRFGWEEMARDVAAVYNREQAGSSDPVGVTTGNWGEASAMHVYREEFALPEPITGDGWFYFEAFRMQSFPKSYVSIGVSYSRLQALFDRVELRGVFTNPHCMPDENNNSIYYCTGPKFDLRRYWIVMYRIDPGFTEALKNRGVDSAVAYYYQRKSRDPGVILFTEQQMNSLGYSYLSRKQAKEAIALFRLNVEAYPGSFNVYDSL